jgi:hypothetical protein
MLSRLLGEEPTTDTPTRIGRMIGDAIGVGVMLALAWITLEGIGVI